MFEYLGRFNRVIVTGPQRTGTTVCGKMIAHDLGYRYIDEAEYGNNNGRGPGHDPDKFRAMVNETTRCVIQAPAMIRHIRRFRFYSGVAIVLMLRDLADIHASEVRFRPQWPYWEDHIAAESVYRYVHQLRRYFPRHWFEIEYESLKDHPLWVPRERRVNWHIKQTCE